MDRTYISEVRNHIDETVKVQGFIENLRSSKAMAFIVLKDITGKLQITIEKEDHPDLVGTIDQLTADSVITVVGKVMANDYVKMGGIEMIPESIQIESIADTLPIVRKCPSSARRSLPPRKRRQWSAPASTSGLITAGLICAPMRTS